MSTNTDDRVQIGQASQTAQEQFRSIGAIIALSPVFKQNAQGDWELDAPRMGDFYNVAAGERFFYEPVASIGAAFLVDRQVVCTANHIVPTARIARKVRLVFGYAMNGAKAPTLIPAADVYEMTPVRSNRGDDLALFMLDRAVRDSKGNERAPLALRRDSEVRDTESLYVMGFPIGLPGKYANNGRILGTTRRFFTADLDVMRGNSGSPVFSVKTREVVGVVSTAPLGLTAKDGKFRTDFSRDANDVEVGISKITNL